MKKSKINRRPKKNKKQTNQQKKVQTNEEIRNQKKDKS